MRSFILSPFRKLSTGTFTAGFFSPRCSGVVGRPEKQTKSINPSSYGVELKERGEQWHGFCPLPTHEGKRNSSSFSANVGRGIWQCCGCGAKGNLIECAARLESLNPDDPADFRKAALLLQKTFGRSDGAEREKPKATPKEEKWERSAQEI